MVELPLKLEVNPIDGIKVVELGRVGVTPLSLEVGAMKTS